MRWQPTEANFNLLVTKTLQVKPVPAPIYAAGEAVCVVQRWPQCVPVQKPPVGLLGARDLAKDLAEIVRCVPIVDNGTPVASTLYGIRNLPALRAAIAKYPYHRYTAVELREWASGETAVRLQTKRKLPATNDTAYKELLALQTEKQDHDPDAPTLQTAQRKREANLKRYLTGETMISKGISETGQRKIKLFGRAVQNQAYRSNPKMKQTKGVFGNHITLTLPGIYPTKEKTETILDEHTGELLTVQKLVPDYAELKRWQRNTIKAIQYHIRKDNPTGNTDLLYCWVIELQERGAPHFHILFAHLMPMEAIKQLWANQIDKWRASNGHGRLTENEINACATLTEVKEYSDYLTKYFLKQDMEIPGQCWGISEAGQKLIRPNKQVPTLLFERYEQAVTFIANVTNRVTSMVNSAGKKIAAIHTNLMQSHNGYVGRLSSKVPKYKPPATWISNPNAAYDAFKTELGRILPINQHRIISRLEPISAIFGQREAVPLYAKGTTIELQL